jgi:aminopeptidase YwaD
METIRTLHKLIAEGELSQPELGIRFLMMPEMTGTYAYFAQHPERVNTTIAALNLDMVGADQSKGGGPLCIEQPPLATPTFVDRYAFAILESISQEAANFTGTTNYSTYHYLQTRFSGGSDHYIVSDPSIGIPCPMIIQWPDKHYHTTTDTPFNLDTAILEKVGVLSTLYVYGLANGGEDEWIQFLFQDIGRRFDSLRASVEWIIKQEDLKSQLEKTLDFYITYEEECLENFRNFARIRKFKRLETQLNIAHQQLKMQANTLKKWAALRVEASTAVSSSEKNKKQKRVKEPDQVWLQVVYKRVFQGPNIS